MNTSSEEMAALRKYVPILYKLRKVGETEKSEEDKYMDLSDQEWFMERDMCHTMLLEAFASGVMAAYHPCGGRALPPGFERFCNGIMRSIEEQFKVTGELHVVTLTLRRLSALYKAWSSAIPEFAEWTESEIVNGPMAIHNAIQWINNELAEQLHFLNKMVSEAEKD